MRGRTNVTGKPEEERTVTAGTSAVTVEPTKGKTMKKVTVDPTPSQTKTVTARTGNVNVTPDSGKLLSGVTVKPTPTQEKTVTSTTSEQTVLPDSGKHLSKVTVEAIPLPGSLTKQAVDKFTFPTRTGAAGLTLNHSLGAKPILALMYANNQPTANYDTYMFNGTKQGVHEGDYSYMRAVYAYYAASTGKITIPAQNIELNVDDTKFTLVNSRWDEMYFAAGVEYTLITMA